MIEKYYIYFFPERDKENPAIKIGYSKHPQKRIKQLQTGHPTKIGCEGWIEVDSEDSAQQLEAKYHATFIKERIRKNGEWFRYTENIKVFLDQLRTHPKFTRYYH